MTRNFQLPKTPAAKRDPGRIASPGNVTYYNCRAVTFYLIKVGVTTLFTDKMTGIQRRGVASRRNEYFDLSLFGDTGQKFTFETLATLKDLVKLAKKIEKSKYFQLTGLATY